jgi:hypothetical protein
MTASRCRWVLETFFRSSLRESACPTAGNTSGTTAHPPHDSVPLPHCPLLSVAVVDLDVRWASRWEHAWQSSLALQDTSRCWDEAGTLVSRDVLLWLAGMSVLCYTLPPAFAVAAPQLPYLSSVDVLQELFSLGHGSFSLGPSQTFRIPAPHLCPTPCTAERPAAHTLGSLGTLHMSCPPHPCTVQGSGP